MEHLSDVEGIKSAEGAKLCLPKLPSGARLQKPKQFWAHGAYGVAYILALMYLKIFNENF